MRLCLLFSLGIDTSFSQIFQFKMTDTLYKAMNWLRACRNPETVLIGAGEG